MTIPLQSQTILIVDDNFTNLEVLSETLTSSGFQVSIATDGESAVEQAKYHPPALMLLDVMMPGIDGFETCRLLKQDPQTAGIPIIFMTALSNTENKVNAFSIGAVDYITKPFQREEVLARVQVQLKLQNLAQTLESQNQILRHEIQQRERAESLLIAAKEEADRANQAKSEFLANMSHEVRTPLNGILGYAQILQTSKNLNDKERKGLNIIHQCGTHLLTLINDVLDLSKIEAQKMELFATSFHFPSFLQGVSEIFSIRAEQKKISFICQFDPDIPNGIFVDEKRLRQVLINLLGNAVKFTEHGAVTFRVKVIEKIASVKPGSNRTFRVRFCIEDTGVGISSEFLDKIFMPFEQVGDLNSQSQGTGLGLAISQKILLLMNSHIQVSSQAHEGSTFWFELDLPEVAEWSQSARVSQRGTIVGYEGQVRKILIVDDRWENRSVALNLLQPLGFEILEAMNGQEGLAKAAECRPDLILADLVMPVMDGFELIRRLRKDSLLHGTPIIASSASVFEAEQCASIAAGANEFLPKPVSVDSLLEMIQSLLELTWVYETENRTDESVGLEAEPGTKDALDSETFVVPSAETLERLYSHARKGDLDSIVEEASQLDEFRFFANELCRLAEGFQVKQLQNFIQQYIEV
ncbi:MAG TPA: response regulator [Stenomitos sp.]